MKVALAGRLRLRRRQLGLSQAALARALGSSQSRVAKMEGADPTVSADLLIRALLALGSTRRDLAVTIGRARASDWYPPRETDISPGRDQPQLGCGRCAFMPEISRFLGIVIGMFYREHGPPHFHAAYGECEAIFHIETGHMIGNFPPRARRLVLDWRRMHQVELLKNWELARAGQPPERIPPLE